MTRDAMAEERRCLLEDDLEGTAPAGPHPEWARLGPKLVPTRPPPEAVAAAPGPPKALLYGVVAAAQLIFSGFQLLAHRHVSSDQALLFTCWREFLAALLLLACARVARPGEAWVPRRPHAGLLAALGAVEAAVIFSVALALTLVSPFNVAVLHPTIPVFATVGAVLLGQESATFSKVCGLLLAVVGAVVVVLSSPHGDLHCSKLGNALVVFQCLLQACYVLAQKRVVTEYSPVWIVAWIYCVGAACLGVATVAARRGDLLLRGGAGLWWTLAYAVVFTGAANFVGLTWANAHLSASVIAGSVTLQPVFTASLGFLAQGAPLVLGQALGGVVIVAGLALAVRAPATPIVDWICYWGKELAA